MPAGKVLGARFALGEQIDHDIPGIRRFLAEDERLDRATVIDVIDSAEHEEVRRVATRAARLRDPRLARIVTTGSAEMDDREVAYVAYEAVPGTRLDTVLAERRIDPRRAVAAIGGAARALAAARAEGLHHGLLRPSSITVTDRGRVVVSGIGVDATAARLAGVRTDPSERGDAAALGALLVRALTGLDAADATVDDLPESLGRRPRELAAALLAGTAPESLDTVIVALSPFDSRALVGFGSIWPVLDLTPEKEQERLAEEERAAAEAEERRQARLAATRDMLDDATLPAAAAGAAAAVAAQHATPELQDSILEHEHPPVEPVETTELPQVVPAAGAQSESEPIPAGAAVQPDGAADKYEAGFDTLEIMVAAQNQERRETTWELVLERLSRVWPRSRAIARSLERARERANSGGPLDGSRVMVLIAIVGIVLAVMLAWSMLDAPLDPSIVIEPDPVPASAVPSASPSPSVEPTTTNT